MIQQIKQQKRFFLTLGGFIGFTVAFLGSAQSGADATVLLRDAAIGCLVGALLFKGLHALLVASFHAAEAERRKATAANADNEAEQEGSSAAVRAE